MKAFALVGLDGEVFVVNESREAIENYLKASGLPDLGETIVEFDYNDEPATEVGLEYKAKIEKMFTDRGVNHFHMNKQIGFYEMHVDERYKLIYDVLTDIDGQEPFKFNDSHRPLNESQPID